MKKLSLALLTATCLLVPAGFAATIPTFEPFADASAVSGSTAYTYPGFLSHQTNALGDQWYSINYGSGFANSNLNTSIVLTNISLSYAGLPASTGNAIIIPRGTAGMGARMFLTDGPTPIPAVDYIYGTNASLTVYYSMILQAANIANLSTTGEFCFGFNNQQNIGDQSNTPGNWAAKVYFKKSGAGYLLGVNKMGNAATATFDTTVRSTNDVLFIVVGYEIRPTSAANNDTVRMWINPLASTLGAISPPAATVTGSSATDSDQNNGGLDNFQMGARSTSQPDLLVIDEFRMGTSWSDVTGGPQVKSLPATGSIDYSSNTVLHANGGGNGLAATFQWQRNGVNLSDSGNVVGSQTKNLTITSATQNNAGTYTFVVTTSKGSATSSAEVFTVTNDPRITTQPTDKSTPPNRSVVFSVAAFGTPTLTYQWLENGTPISNGAQFTGVTTPNLTINSAQTSDNGASFSCNVQNGLGTVVTSSNAVLTVQDPAITSDPQSVTINYQGTANFNISAAGAVPLTYRWQLNGADLADGPAAGGATISGSATPNLTVASATYLQQGNYVCVVQNGASATTTSDTATLAVIDPYIVTQPTTTSAVTGATATLSVTAAGSPTLTYQWYKGTNALTDGPTANGSTISGSTAATLTISSAATTDTGTYSVHVSGASMQVITSSNAVFTAYAPAGIASVFPVTRTQRVGDHMAFVVTSTGTGPFTYFWSHNGSAYGTTTSKALSLTNLQVSDAGTYSVTISNAVGVGPSANVTLNVSANLLPISSNNVIVMRVGDGAQSLNNSTGNTLYMDQFQTDGTYVNTIMVPDAPTLAFGSQSIAGVNIGGNVMLSGLGAGDDASYENMLTRSMNQQYLNFAAYNFTIPSGANPINGKANIRGIGAVNALGFYQLAYTNFGLYSGGNMFIRSVVSDDGLIDFWTTGAAGSGGGIKYTQVGVANYAGGSGIPAVDGSPAGTRVVDIAGGNVVYTDSTNNIGINAFDGLPKPASGTVPSALILGEGGSPVDFAASPDLQTVYIADDQDSTVAGGIQRWDTNSASGGWTYAYTLSPGVGTNGALGLTVDFSASSTWGPGVTGAIIYATTSGKGNSLVKIVDNGAGSAATVLTTAGPNQLLRGVRFGPVLAPVQITSQPQDVTDFAGHTVSLSVGVVGDAPFSYQWKKNGADIPGATNSTLIIANAQVSDNGNYTVVVSDPVPSSATSDIAVVTITAVPPAIVIPMQSRVETAGDHTAFTVLVTGSIPFSYAWTHNGSPISNATGSALVLNNIQSADSGTYTVTVNNANGGVSSSATLTVTAGLQQLSQANIVVVRVGDGSQPLSSATGNTIYLDQYTPGGTYVNTIMLPDTLPSALIASGSGAEALTESVMTMSQNGTFLNVGGFNVAQPYTGTGGVGYGSGNVGNIRGFGAIDSYGYFSLVLTNVSLYNASTQFRSACSSDGVANFWTTGVGSSGFGMKYVHNGGATSAIAGGLSGTRVVDITPHGNLAYTDVGDSGQTGLNAISGLPTITATPTLVIDVGPTGSPNDFSISPDVNTVYIADDSDFSSAAGYGGIERWDNTGSGYTLSYTLPTGGNSLGGARCIVADYSASGSWGPGVNGAVIYATTSEGSTNSIVRIVDNGPDSTGTVLATAGPNQLFRGMRFSPAPASVAILGQPVGQTVGVGGTATFTVSAGGGPFTYQWQLNGQNLTDGPSPSGTGAIISGSTSQVLTVSNVGTADSGENFTVVVSNPTPGSSTTSSAAALAVLYTQFTPGGAVAVNSDHTVQLNFSGSAGTGYRIWGSTNVALKPVTSTWTLLTSGTFSGGPDSFVDTNAPAFRQQFYTITIP